MKIEREGLAEDRYIKIFFLFLYAALTAFLMAHHELWRDEWLAINVATETKGLSDLLSRLRLEGHPPLWYLLIRIAWSIYPDEVIIKILHLLISWAFAYVLLYRIRQALFIKVLILYSYFFFFEYTIPVRNYNLVLLFSFLFIAELQKEPMQPGRLILCLLGMAASHAYGVLVAATFVFYLCLGYRRQVLAFLQQKQNIFILIALFLLVLTGILIFLPPQNHTSIDRSKWKVISIIKFAPKCLSAIWDAFVPLPGRTLTFWNSNIMDVPVSFLSDSKFASFLYKVTNNLTEDAEKKSRVLGYFLKLPFIPFILCLVYRRFRNEKQILLSLAFGWVLIYLFQLYVYHGFLRHEGFYFLLYLFFILISPARPGRIISSLLVLHVFVAGWAFTYEFRYNFSSAKPAAAYIQNHLHAGKKDIIFMETYTYVPSVAGYLRQPLYIAGQAQPQRYVLWENAALPPIETTILDCRNRMLKAKASHCIIICTDPYDMTPFKKVFGNGYTFARIDFAPSISRENFFVVSISKK